MNLTYRNDSELYFIGNMELISIHYFTEVKEHASVPVHTFNEAKAISHRRNHTLRVDKWAVSFTTSTRYLPVEYVII